MNIQDHRFSDAEREVVYRVIRERRDMRHFEPGAVDEATLQRLLTAAHQAPSVGLMQPWRIIHITTPNLRKQIHELVEQERLLTAKALNEREDEFMRLKVEGINECGTLLVVTLSDQRQQHIFGRRTIPEMDLASVACAIQNMWLAARAEGLGMGWVSLFSPQDLAELLQIPAQAKPIAVLCLGHVKKFYSQPMLELENWRQACSLQDILYRDQWGQTW